LVSIGVSMSMKPCVVEPVAHRAGDAVALAQRCRSSRAPQVDVAVAQAHFLADLSRRAGTAAARSGSAIHFARAAPTLPEARLALTVPAGRARTRPRTRTTNSLRRLSASANSAGRVRIEHDLQQALAVPQVDEDHAAMVATAVHPAGDGDLCPVSCSLTCPQ
jgi:hypothetical protein